MFSKILIANRGEIAVRIIRACKEMGIATVAVYSAADADSLHAALADESYCIGGAEASDSYLNQERIVSAACLAGAQAIHPGYGFLSESADFAQLCKKNGIVFIGPSPDIMEKISDKASLKEQMEAASIQVIPGTMPLSSEEAAIIEAEKLGYPVMLKASAGGGGRAGGASPALPHRGRAGRGLLLCLCGDPGDARGLRRGARLFQSAP